MKETIAALSALTALLMLVGAVFVSPLCCIALLAACTVFVIAESGLALPMTELDDIHQRPYD